jgi:hypothetical protein
MWSDLPTRATQKRRRDSKDYQVPARLRNCQIGENVYTTEEGHVTNEEPSDDSSSDESYSSEESTSSEETEESEESEEPEEDIKELVKEAQVIQERVDRETAGKKERVRREIWFRKVTQVWEEWENTDSEFRIVNSKPKGTFWGRHEPDFAMCVRDGYDEYYLYVLESGSIQCECEEFETCDIMEMVNHLRKKKQVDGVPAACETVCSGDQSPHAPTH